MLATRTLIVVMLFLNVFEATGGQGGSVPDNLRQRIEQLPTKLTQLYRAKEKDLAGSTASMTDGLVSISNGLLEDAVTLQSFVTGQQPDKLRTEIRRDQEAIARSVDYERHAEGWGGTITTIEAAAAALRHVENLISFYVTRIFEKDQSFKLESWYAAWRKASKRDS
jgi:hypothetical protein